MLKQVLRRLGDPSANKTPDGELKALEPRLQPGGRTRAQVAVEQVGHAEGARAVGTPVGPGIRLG